MTVSNVVNGNFNKVSKDTIERINMLIQEMQYVPNANARSLSTNKTTLLAMCVRASSSKNILEDPYTSFIVGTISRRAQQNGFTVILENEADTHLTVNKLKSWNVAGAIFLGYSGKQIDTIKQSLSIPFVCLDSYPESDDIITIGTNDYKAGWLAGKYLSSLGHKNLVFASGQTLTESNSKTLNPLLYYRYEGFKEALVEEGIILNKENILSGDITYEEGISMGSHLGMQNDVSAVFATADILAVGIIEGLRLSGKRVPQDMSVLGFDDLPISRLIQPKLSTISQQTTLKGENAIDLLIKRINDPALHLESIQHEVTLIERQSTLPI